MKKYLIYPKEMASQSKLRYKRDWGVVEQSNDGNEVIARFRPLSPLCRAVNYEMQQKIMRFFEENEFILLKAYNPSSSDIDRIMEEAGVL